MSKSRGIPRSVTKEDTKYLQDRKWVMKPLLEGRLKKDGSFDLRCWNLILDIRKGCFCYIRRNKILKSC